MPKLRIDSYISSAAYFRLLAPKLLEDSIEKIIYLDCDIIVLGNIYEIYKINIDDYYLAAVRDQFIISKNYFNSGVLLLNLKKWRQEDNKVVDSLFSFIENNYKELKHYDQTALNAIFKNNYLPLDKKYNYIRLGFGSFWSWRLNTKPLIVHYAGKLKPWQYKWAGAYGKLYFKYLKNTAWSNFVYKDKNLKNRIKKIIHFFAPFGLVKILSKAKQFLFSLNLARLPKKRNNN